ncbi:MAG: hypothetical protein H6817_08245 [Phycisphaerales bacterium]|nr:hypothetical protein [Phycisphaerales bacterium]
MTRTLIEFGLRHWEPHTEALVELVRTQRDAFGVALSGVASRLLNSRYSQLLPPGLRGLPVEALRIMPGRYPRLAAASAADREIAFARAEQTIFAAERMGVARVEIEPAAVAEPAEVRYADALNHTHDQVQRLVPALERTGVTLCIPADRCGFLRSPPELRELLDRIACPLVGASVDIGDGTSHCAPDDWLPTLGSHVQIVGSRWIRDALANNTQVDLSESRLAAIDQYVNSIPNAVVCDVPPKGIRK